jgi:hypothetical protein
VFALTGCGPTSTRGATTTPTPTVAAAAALAAAVAKTASVDLTFVLHAGPGGSDITGTYEATNGVASFSTTSNGEQTSFTADGDSLYLAGPSSMKGLTVRLHANRLPPTNPLAMFADPLATATLLSGVASATLHGDTQFNGSIDLTKITTKNDGAAALRTYVNTLARDRATDVKFTAASNADGYLVSFDVTLPNLDNGKDSEYIVTLADFGQKVSNATPTGGSVIEAPASAYNQT